MYYDLVESGKRIKALRKKHGLTQEQLAEQLGVAANTIARIETGNRGISIDLAIELVVRFDTTLDYIFLGRESSPKIIFAAIGSVSVANVFCGSERQNDFSSICQAAPIPTLSSHPLPAVCGCIVLRKPMSRC